ncbi:hypothetical protein WP3S18E02_03280 [Aeromonas caviae]|nr:hypothetical protein WP3S18E02_03280 [Aeromonas caviae]
MSRPRDRMSSERRQTMGQIGQGRAPLDPIWRENRDVRSGLWPKPWMAKAKGPSARAVGQAGESKEPDEVGRISGGGRSIGDFSLATQRKVTRPSPKGGRNPVEASGLASCTATPCHSPITRSGRLRLTANRPYDGNETSHQDPSPALPFAGEGAKASPPARCVAEHRPTMPDATGKGGRGRPYRPKNGSQSLNTGCNPACRTAAATSPTGRSSWMANCSSSSLSPSA